MLSRLAHWCYRRRRLVLGLWVVLLIGSQFASSAVGGKSSMSFKLPASDSQRAQDLLAERFPTESGATGDVVIAAPAGVRSSAVEARANALFEQIARTPHVVEVTSPYSTQGANQISHDGTIAFAQVHFDQNIDKLKTADADQVKSEVARAGAPGFDVALSGNMFQSRKPPGGTELVGVLAAMVILLIAFGSVLAMGLPILTALFGIGVGLAGVSLLANVFSMPSFASILAAMIGIGVGIDYALFIVTRYRQGLQAGLDPERAIVKSVTTSGKAVLFAGSTVVISLLGMFAMGLSFVRGLAVGASLAVVFTMCASVTLLPAVLGFVGPKIDKFALPWTHKQRAERPYDRRVPLESVDPTPAVDFGGRRLRRPDRPRASRLLDHARELRRREQPEDRHDARRLRPPGQGLRARLQQSAAGRGRGSEPRRGDRAPRTARGDRARARCGRGHTGPGRAVGYRRRHAGLPEDRSSGPKDRRAHAQPARARDPRRGRGNRARRAHRRQHRDVRRPLELPRLAPADLHARRARPVVPLAARRVPLARRARSKQ